LYGAKTKRNPSTASYSSAATGKKPGRPKKMMNPESTQEEEKTISFEGKPQKR
jgi:hypothetical protein